jgi:hypothetical protein
MKQRDSYVLSVERVEVIEVRSIYGSGTSEDPYRSITEYFLNGIKIGRKEICKIDIQTL